MKPSRSPSPSLWMLVRVAERIRGARTLARIAHCVIEELAARPGVRTTALVLCDRAGEPALWIGDAAVDRAAVHAYLDGGHRDDACFARSRETYTAQVDGALVVAPLLGDAGVIGMLRVVTDGKAEHGDLATIAAYISIRIALLGLALDDARPVDALTPRQREVAELVGHGCTNLEIARMLDISANAVKKHVSRVLAALDVSNRTELAALTGRWQPASGIDQVLPTSVQVVVRNPAKPVGTDRREEVA